MRKISLTQGKYALVDDEDFEKVSKLKWFAYKNGNFFYARHSARHSENKKSQYKLLHRFIMKARSKKKFVDHINGNGLDNRRKNLRIVTHQQNTWNRQKQKNNTSGYIGVYFDKKNGKGKWKSQISIKGKKTNLGRYDSRRKAAIAYDNKALELRGEFAKLNFPNRKLCN